MKSRRDNALFQEFLLNSWPAHHYYFLNGWILRFTEGVTDRANSVFPISYTGTQETLDDDIITVEKAYKAHKLSPIFTIPEFHKPTNLKEKLTERGYKKYSFTTALGIDITKIHLTKINANVDYVFYNSRVEEFSHFLAKYSKRNKDEQSIINEITQRIIIPKKCFLVVKSRKEIIGTFMGILNHQGFLYIGDVLVHPHVRRQKIATSMLTKVISDWARPNKAKYIWLQVENDNLGAQNLYQQLGMKKIYEYYYMKRNVD